MTRDKAPEVSHNQKGNSKGYATVGVPCDRGENSNVKGGVMMPQEIGGYDLPPANRWNPLRPLSTRRFGQPRRLGSRRASSPFGGSRGRLVHEILCLFPGSAPLLFCSLPSAVLFPSPLGAKLGNVCGVVSSCMAERVARTRQLACGNVGLVLGKVGYTFSSVARLCRKSAG